MRIVLRKYYDVTREILYNIKNNLTSFYDGYALDPVGLLDVDLAGGLADLNPLTAADTSNTIQW